MEIDKLLNQYAKAPQTKALAKALSSKTINNLMVDGLAGSSCPVLFAAMYDRFPDHRNLDLIFCLPKALLCPD